MRCITNLDNCKCLACLEVKKEATKFYRMARINREDTFGLTHGSGGTFPPVRPIIRPITDREPSKITKENWFFMTGMNWRSPFIHNDRCGAGCKCDERKCKEGN